MNAVAEAVRFQPLNAEDFEVERGGVTLHVMRYYNGNACVVERGADGGRDKGAFAAYDRKPFAEAEAAMIADGWTLKATQQMSVTQWSHGYNNTTIQGVCSPDVTVEDVKKRFYHDYFGGRAAWVSDGKFGCTIHTD
jgi:hypothetical protein